MTIARPEGTKERQAKPSVTSVMKAHPRLQRRPHALNVCLVSTRVKEPLFVMIARSEDIKERKAKAPAFHGASVAYIFLFLFIFL